MSDAKTDGTTDGPYSLTYPPGPLIIDTMLVLGLFDKGPFERGYREIIEQYRGRGFTPVIPRMVEAEVLMYSESFRDYEDRSEYMRKHFEIWPMTDEVFQMGAYLHFVYRLHNHLKGNTGKEKNLLPDLIIGGFVADFEDRNMNKEPWQVAYLLTEDTKAFHPPYFIEMERHATLHKKTKKSQLIRRFRFDINSLQHARGPHALYQHVIRPKEL